MAKPKRKDKELSRLRREVEILKAQLAGQKDMGGERTAGVEEKSKDQLQLKAGRRQTEAAVQQIDPAFLKTDLIKSGILTLIIIGTLVALAVLL